MAGITEFAERMVGLADTVATPDPSMRVAPGLAKAIMNRISNLMTIEIVSLELFMTHLLMTGAAKWAR